MDDLVANSRLDKMISLAQNAYLFKYLSFLGLILLIVDFSFNFLTLRQLNKDKEAMQLEMNTLKAKLFDMQEAEKNVIVAKKEEEK